MSVQQNFSRQPRWFVPGRLPLQEFTQEKCLVSQSLRTRILREKITELVPKYGSATRFEDDDGRAGVNLFTQSLQNPAQIFLGRIQHAEIIEWASAAEMTARNTHVETGAL